MKQQMTLRSLLVIASLFLGLNLHADVVTIHVETAGTLSSYIASNEKDLITSLTLTGDLNGSDIRFIREMAGWDVDGDATSGKLSVLDISGANIVKGGDYYYYDINNNFYHTSDDNIMGKFMFHFTRLTSITIPNSVTSIDNNAFSYCSGLTSITIPNSVNSIGDGAFEECSGLTSVTVSSSVTSIGGWAFNRCSRLTSITIPDKVTSIGSYAFWGCKGLTSVSISNSVTSIGTYAFFGCTALTSITIPNSVTSIGEGAFAICSRLASVTISNGITSIAAHSFTNCIKLISITIPNSVTSIGTYAFSGCSELISVTIPEGVTSIGEGAFATCSGLTSITIPNSVTSMGIGAFARCITLKEIHNKNANPQIMGFNALLEIDKTNCTLYVPEGSYSAYRAAIEWGDFVNIIEEDITSTSQIQSSNIKVYTEAEAIVIEGAKPREQILLYTESGALVQTIQATCDIVQINVPRGHTYLIKTAGKTFKFTL